MTAPVRRALCALRLQRFTAAHLAMLAELEADHDEIVIAVTDAEHAYTPEHPASAGERIARVAPLLRARLSKPHYLLPIARGSLSPAQYAARIRLYAPRFDTFVAGRGEEARLAERVLGCAVRVVDVAGDAEMDDALGSTGEGPPPRRGLFITRAQPFHVGHREFVRRIAAEQDEVVVLVARGNASHTLTDPATAGERVEMIRPLLEREAPGRHHLCAAPYLEEDGRNFAELELLLPRFQTVYTNSPSTTAMAEGAGYPVLALERRVTASGREVRRRMVAGEDLAELVPPEVLEVLVRCGIIERARKLAAPEPRG